MDQSFCWNCSSGTVRTFVLFGALVIGPISHGIAQTPEQSAASPELRPASAEILLDFRARVPSSGRIQPGLHSTMYSLQTTDGFLPRHTRVDIFGMAQYGSFRWHNAVVETELPPLRRSDAPQRLQAGLLRLPFGIYNYRETYGSGLIDYPMPRVDYAFNAVDWGAPGVGWTGSTGNLQIETAAVNGRGAGVWGNLNRLSGQVVRLQTFVPPYAILGVSGWSGDLETYPDTGIRHSVRLGGVDWRITRSHLLLRGEIMGGTLSGSQTRGGYFDAYYRLPGWEKWTLVSRIEGLKPATNLPEAHQFTVGGRYTFLPAWTIAANWRENNLRRAYSFTWTPVTGHRGDFLIQLLHQQAFP